MRQITGQKVRPGVTGADVGGERRIGCVHSSK
jgi:hypothetical protein